jgi:hypothetical protein
MTNNNKLEDLVIRTRKITMSSDQLRERVAAVPIRSD